MASDEHTTHKGTETEKKSVQPPQDKSPQDKSPQDKKPFAGTQDFKEHVLPWYLDFLASMRLLTRLPFPDDTDADEGHARRRLKRSTRSFPLTGLVVGGIGALTLFGLTLFAVPYEVACIVALMVMTIVTGALHEDGLSDVVDSFGGDTPEKRYAIMKDSRIGTYGTLALISVILLKLAALLSIGDNPLDAAKMLIVAACTSRAAMVALPCFLKPIEAPNPRQRHSLSRHIGKLSPAHLIVPTALGSALALIGFGPYRCGSGCYFRNSSNDIHHHPIRL